MTLTVPSCLCGPVAAYGAAASSSSWIRAEGQRVTVGVEAGSPRPSLLPRALRPGWVGGALASWAAALLWLVLALALSSPAHDSAPGPQVTPFSKFGVTLSRGFRAPTTPGSVAWRVSVCLSVVRS